MEELLALELNALIGWAWRDDLAYRVLEAGLPIIHLTETSIAHPLSASPRGMREGARMLAAFLVEQLGGRGRVVVVGGLTAAEPDDLGDTRMAGIQETFGACPQIVFNHVPSAGMGAEAERQIRAVLRRFDAPFDGLLGLTDSLALAARDAARSLNLIGQDAPVVGMNGDPLALAAIARGDMLATAALCPEDLGAHALDLAYRTAQTRSSLGHLDFEFRLVTADNIAGVMAETLVALSSLPDWLAETSQQRQQRRLYQLEASLDIISRIQSRLDSYRQLRDIVEQVCAEYGYTAARIYRWVEQQQRLFLIYPGSPGSLDVLHDLVGGSWKDILEPGPDGALPAEGATSATDGHRPGSLIIADGLGWVGDWYDLTGASSNSVVDQIASWATEESRGFARDFEARHGLTPSPSAAGLSYDYANLWIHVARQVWRDAGELSSQTLADFIWNRLLTGQWSYTGGCIMREYRYSPETMPDPVVGPGYFTFSVLEYLDGEGTIIFSADPAEGGKPHDRVAPPAAEPRPAGPPARTFRLGVLGPFTGLNSPVGAEMKGAVEMAFERVGYRVGPYQIELVWIDSQADPALGAQAYEAAILRQGIQAGLLGWHSPVARACMEVTARHKIPHFFSLGGAGAINEAWHTDPQKYFYWVKGWPDPAKLTANYVHALEAAIVRGLWQPQAKTAAFWGEDTEWGRGFAAGLKRQLESAGWEIVAEAFFPPDETEFLPLLTRIKEQHPALLAGTASNPTTYSAFIRQAHKLGLERMFTWSPASEPSIALGESEILGRALQRNEPIYIPAGSQGARPRREAAADNRARLVLPIRRAGKVLGLLDLRSRRATWHTRPELVALQVLADQLGLAMWDARLHGRAAQAEAAAEQTDRANMRLLANVSHELRTPLNVILGFTQRALDSLEPHQAALPAPLVNELEHIHRASKHLLRMTNDLLDFSRTEIQELKLLPKMIDPQPLLAEAFQSLAGSDADGARAWRLELPERLPLIQADPVRVRQIVLNLLGNAQRFTDHGQITLGAEVAPPSLHIWVQDTGLGIPADRQEQVFEPFVTHSEPDREGTGLGLSIARQLAALHHGSLTVESHPGAGSTFHLRLPLPTLDEPAEAPEPGERCLLLISSRAEPPAEVTHFCRRQGLEIRRLQLTDTLDDLLGEVQPAALAWDLAETRPGEWAVVERLRRFPPLGRIPFIVYGQGRHPGGEALTGLTNFVVKPVDARSLIETIEAMRPAAAGGPILAVDDDPQALEYLAGLLRQDCPTYDVRTAGGGVAALEFMEREIPSLVILDLRMPGVDGFQVLEWMRLNARTSRVPVLVMTGHELSLADIKRLEQHTLVTVQSKGILSDGEIAAAVHRSLLGVEGLPPHTSALVLRAVAYLQGHYAEPLTRGQVAGAVGISQNYLSQIFRKELGLSPWDYLTRYRIKQAERLLRCTNDSVGAIGRRVGFADPAYFSRVFRQEIGISPTAFRAS